MLSSSMIGRRNDRSNWILDRLELRAVRTLAKAYELIGVESPQFEKLEQYLAVPASEITV